MYRKLPLFVVLLLGLAVSFAAAATPPEAQPVAVSATAISVNATPAVDFAAAGTCPGRASAVVTEAGEATPEWLASSSCCRPQCVVDSNCDKVCGPGNGVCRLVNSCCKACLCLAAF